MGLKVCDKLTTKQLANFIEKVYAVSSSSLKRNLALSLGAFEYIDSSSINVAEYIQSLGGAKLIICTAPYSEAINDILPAVGKNGERQSLSPSSY
jgi:D-arabinose 1-dehydrogenase-like Zn-dependent alcohol dehydrogenase